MSPGPLVWHEVDDPKASQNFREIHQFLGETEQNVALAQKLAESQPAALVHNSVAQNIASGATATINFDVEDFDTDGLHDNVTNNARLTAPAAGLYLLLFNGTVSASTPVCSARFLQNGTAITTLINLPVPWPALVLANPSDY